MAFDDYPKVDLNAERSEESVLKCRQLFSRKNGFISHTVDGTNDYGTDITCQIIENNNVKPYQFPIQIKSKISYPEKILLKQSFLSTNFNTSRLAYLIKHSPTSGIIVIYDEKGEQLYYDFAYEIYNRIRASHKDDLWKNQESATILIPKSNILDTDGIQSIYSRCLNFFKNHDRLLLEHGKSYGLPIVEELSSKLKSPLEILEDIGELMFFYHKFPEILGLLDHLDKKSLRRKKIAYLGAITYTEIGDVVEADYFFKLCNRDFESFSQKERETLNFQKFKFQFYSGKFSRSKLKEMLHDIRLSSNNIDDLIYLRINLLNLDLMDKIGIDGFDEEVFIETESVFKLIIQSNRNENSKHFQLISTADILSKSINSILTGMLIDTKIIESLGGNPKKSARIKKLDKIMALNNRCHKYFRDSIDFASKEDNKLLLAHSHLALAISFFGQCIAFFIAEKKFDDKKITNQLLSEILKSSLNSYNIFNNLNLRPFAYTSITLSFEIHLLAKYWLNYDLNSVTEISKIEDAVNSFEKDDFKKRFSSVVEKIYQRHGEFNSMIPNSTTSSVYYSEEQIEVLARTFARDQGVPENRLENIKKSIRDYQLFYSRCKNPDFILASDENPFGPDAYQSAEPKFAVVSKSSNLLIAEGYNVEMILRKIGYS
ncbi:MAG: DUF4365 domain-containing protein [Cyclobacterium sp.]|uniref:DUF4365 domain-containing protein n=1 Tax=Cyclobacterium sp. TaxID=1966343 RepID=UPI00397086A2